MPTGEHGPLLGLDPSPVRTGKGQSKTPRGPVAAGSRHLASTQTPGAAALPAPPRHKGKSGRATEGGRGTVAKPCSQPTRAEGSPRDPSESPVLPPPPRRPAWLHPPLHARCGQPASRSIQQQPRLGRGGGGCTQQDPQRWDLDPPTQAQTIAVIMIAGSVLPTPNPAGSGYVIEAASCISCSHCPSSSLLRFFVLFNALFQPPF